jgi:hypothetical protein
LCISRDAHSAYRKRRISGKFIISMVAYPNLDSTPYFELQTCDNPLPELANIRMVV